MEVIVNGRFGGKTIITWAVVFILLLLLFFLLYRYRNNVFKKPLEMARKKRYAEDNYEIIDVDKLEES